MRAVFLFVLSLVLLACMPAPRGSKGDSELAQAWAQAYRDQHDRLVDKGQALGYKAGLTSRQSQLKFDSDRAVAGNLYHRYDLDDVVQLSGFMRPMLEVELAFRLRQPVDRAVSSIAELKQLVSEIAPALELPDLGLIQSATPGPLDIVRANVAAQAFVVGQAMPVPPNDVDALTIRLSKNGLTVLEAEADSLLGGQWGALLELINNRIAAGWEIVPGQWLLTGAIGGMRPLQAGRYTAEIMLRDVTVARLPLSVSGE